MRIDVIMGLKVIVSGSGFLQDKERDTWQYFILSSFELLMGQNVLFSKNT